MASRYDDVHDAMEAAARQARKPAHSHTTRRFSLPHLGIRRQFNRTQRICLLLMVLPSLFSPVASLKFTAQFVNQPLSAVLTLGGLLVLSAAIVDRSKLYVGLPSLLALPLLPLFGFGLTRLLSNGINLEGLMVLSVLSLLVGIGLAVTIIVNDVQRYRPGPTDNYIGGALEDLLHTEIIETVIDATTDKDEVDTRTPIEPLEAITTDPAGPDAEDLTMMLPATHVRLRHHRRQLGYRILTRPSANR